MASATVTISERTANDEYWGEVLEVEVPAAYATDLARSIAAEVESSGEQVQKQFDEQLRDPRTAKVAPRLGTLQSTLSLFDQLRDEPGRDVPIDVKFDVR